MLNSHPRNGHTGEHNTVNDNTGHDNTGHGNTANGNTGDGNTVKDHTANEHLSNNHGFRRAAVVGAGLMGRRIAGVLAAGGLSVTLHDARPDILEAAAQTARHTAAAVGGSGAVGEVTAVAGLAEAVADGDLVVEAIVEDLAAKQELFARLRAVAPDAVLATNTSVLPVGAVCAQVPDTARCLGTHWWNPPDLVPVVEVVPAAGTDPQTTQRVEALLRHLGKTPVRVARDVPGFIGNRLQHALWREAIALVAEGVCDAATVDLVVRNTIGLRLACLGPIENADYVGLDLTLAIHEAVLPSLNRDPHPNPLLRDLVARGDLGAKTGRGFLAWPSGAAQETADRLAAHITHQVAAVPFGGASSTTKSDNRVPFLTLPHPSERS